MAKKKEDNEFDERRETLVMEQKTTWADGIDVSDADRPSLAASLHANAKEAKRMEYKELTA